MRILVAEDDALLAEGLTRLLTKAGHGVDRVKNGIGADSALRATPYELLVLDIGLPDIDGYELARRLRDAHPGIKLIALTGYGQEGDRHAARAAGFDAHCAKPVTTMALVELIDGLRDTDAA